MKKILGTIIFACVLLLQPLFGQDINSDVSKRGTTAAPFLTIVQGARAMGMGSAFVALANDQSSLYWNPAGITDTYGTGFMFDHTSWFADIEYNYAAGTMNLGSFGTIGMSFTASNYGEMNVTTVDNPGGNGETFGVSDVAFSVSYAMKLTDNFSIGFNPKYIYQKIAKMSASAVAIDLGVKYVTPFKGVTLGMSISNFGPKMQMTGNSALVLFDQNTGSTGNNGRIPAELETDEWALPLTFRVGIAYDALKTDMHKLVIAADALHPADNYESVNVGGEYTFNDFLFIRGGYKNLFLQNAEEKYTFGFGVKQEMVGVSLQVDYAYQEYTRLKNAQKITVSVNF
ncbi:MAG: PorV/PorQ family protein [Acidobacteriota bacterium]